MSFTLNELKEKVQESSLMKYQRMILHFKLIEPYPLICSDWYGNEVKNPFFQGGTIDKERLVKLKEEMSKAFVPSKEYSNILNIFVASQNRGENNYIEQLETLYDSLCHENDFVLK
jgi:hypothetical protein